MGGTQKDAASAPSPHHLGARASCPRRSRAGSSPGSAGILPAALGGAASRRARTDVSARPAAALLMLLVGSRPGSAGILPAALGSAASRRARTDVSARPAAALLMLLVGSRPGSAGILPAAFASWKLSWERGHPARGVRGLEARAPRPRRFGRSGVNCPQSFANGNCPQMSTVHKSLLSTNINGA